MSRSPRPDQPASFTTTSSETNAGPYQKNRRTHQQRRDGKPPVFAFYRGSVDVAQYYFYILDRDFGLCFIKFSSYPPFNVRVWLHGHDWAKRQLHHRRVAYEDLDNGFLSCEDPTQLQRTCAALRPDDIDAVLCKWLRLLPHPFTPDDRRVGFLYNLSIMQMEVSTTHVFDRPIHGRQFFEEVIRTMAVLSAVGAFAFTPEGLTNADLRARVGALYDPGPKGYTPHRMTYDLRRLRLKGLIQRVPKSHRYVFTASGRRAALFLTKSYVRLVRPTLDRREPQLPDDAPDLLRRAWKACENAFEHAIQETRIARVDQLAPSVKIPSQQGS